MKDEIIQEVWAAKDAIAAKCGHDVRLLVEYLREKEKNTPGVQVVDLRAKSQSESRTN
jgi:hypothetical protein